MVLKKESLIIREESGELTTLYNRKTKQTHVLNRTAAKFWDMCEGKTLLDAVDEYVNEYACMTNDREQLADDAHAIYATLSEMELVMGGA